MNQIQKQEIQALVHNYCDSHESQAKAVARLKNVSEANIINIRKGKWEGISSEMWCNVGKQVGWNVRGNWALVETQDFHTLITYFADAKEYSNVFSIVGPAGSGKTFTAEWYAKRMGNVYHLPCAEHWNRKMFLAKLLEKMGKDNTGYNVSEMLDLIVDTLLHMESPLIILDEADKLNDQVLYFFITIYNQLKGKCAIILMATDFLQKRIVRGVKLNKKGYAEIFSRIGRKFISIHGTDKAEVKQICEANGITEAIDINEIYNDYEGDLRRVERLVHKKKLIASQKTA